MNRWQLARTTCCSLAAAILLSVFAAPAAGALVAQWTFEESRPTSAGPHAPEEGTGILFAFHQDDSEYSSPVGNGSEHSFSSTGWAINDYFQIHYPQGVVTPQGFFAESVRFQFDMASNAAQPPAFALNYSIDGGPYFRAANAIKFSDAPPRDAWNSSVRQFYYSTEVVIPHQATKSISFRLVCNDTLFPRSPDVNVRLDNVTIEGVPEPASGLLAACAALGVAAFRRRWRSCSPS